MGKETEPLDSLAGRIGSGIHLVATATLCAKEATREELDLAALILRRDPKRSAPMEQASTVETFNRLLDVAIDSANASVHCSTRAERRALLANDLGRAAVILLDCSTLADLINAKLDLDLIKLGLVVEAPGPIPLLEALEPSAEELELEEEDLEELARAGSTPLLSSRYALESNPGADSWTRDHFGDGGSYAGLEFIGGLDRGAEFNPSVND